MGHRAVGLWGGFLLLSATALLGAMLLVSGPAVAAYVPLRAVHPTNHGHAHHRRVDDPHGRHPLLHPSPSAASPPTASSSPLVFHRR